MEKLFKDSEVMVNERPTKITEQQEKDYLNEVAEEIISNGWSDSDIEKIVYDLSDICYNDSGYEIAKKLEGYNSKASYKITTPFIEFLDDFENNKSDILRENVKAWVKAFNPKPKFKEGEKLAVDKPLYAHKDIGDVVYVTGINYEEANYYIHSDPKRNGGYVLPFEKVESNCVILSQ